MPPADIDDRPEICGSKYSAGGVRRETEQKRFGTRRNDSLDILRQNAEFTGRRRFGPAQVCRDKAARSDYTRRSLARDRSLRPRG